MKTPSLSHNSNREHSLLYTAGVIMLYITIYTGLTWFFYDDARPADGPLRLGIPFPFYFGGGWCGVPCGPYIQWKGVILDVFIFTIPIIIFFILKHRVLLFKK